MAIRFDKSPIQNFEELPDGRLRVMATISRTGKLDYLQSDGTIRTENVSESTLFDSVWLDSVGLAPVTLEHPDVGMVTPANFKKYAVGSTGSQVFAHQDKGLVDVVFVVADAEAIASVKAKKTTEVSAGYTTKVVQDADGKFHQTERVLNHCALVEKGRAGAAVSLHMDSADWAVQVDNQIRNSKFEIPDSISNFEFRTSNLPKEDSIDSREEKLMPKWKGFEVSDELMNAITSEMDNLKSKFKKDTDDGVMSAKLETTVAQVAELTKQLTEVTTKTDSLQQERDRLQVDLHSRLVADALSTAKNYLPKDFKSDSIADIHKAALAKSLPTLKLEGKSDDALQAAFDTLLSMPIPKTDASTVTDIDPLRGVLDSAGTTGTRSDVAPESRADQLTKELTQRRLERSRQPV